MIKFSFSLCNQTEREDERLIVYYIKKLIFYDQTAEFRISNDLLTRVISKKMFTVRKLGEVLYSNNI